MYYQATHFVNWRVVGFHIIRNDVFGCPQRFPRRSFPPPDPCARYRYFHPLISLSLCLPVSRPSIVFPSPCQFMNLSLSLRSPSVGPLLFFPSSLSLPFWQILIASTPQLPRYCPLVPSSSSSLPRPSGADGVWWRSSWEGTEAPQLLACHTTLLHFVHFTPKDKSPSPAPRFLLVFVSRTETDPCDSPPSSLYRSIHLIIVFIKHYDQVSLFLIILLV